MKQKRKVKSLISSNDKSNVWLTALLCLLWWILVFWAVALFTSSVWVLADTPDTKLNYVGIDDQKEVLINLGFAPKNNLGSPVDNMYLSWNSFFVKWDKWLMLNESAASIKNDTYVNYLWWEGDWLNVASNNVTIIGWWRNNRILEGNNNATSLWGIGNKVDKWANRVAAPVMLWWSDNLISVNQEGSAIVWWNNNIINEGGQYDFIIWWKENIVTGNNVIVWWEGVNVNGMSNLFAFSDNRGLSPKWWNAFYLNVMSGVWLNRAVMPGRSWLSSSGAVSFGEININDTSCWSDDIGVLGTWKISDTGGTGCLVWCTKKSAVDGSWEMLDHWEACETSCNGNDRCKLIPDKPVEAPEDYTGYCTTWIVNIENATQCAPDLLNNYKNVVFETYLIDSEWDCPNPKDDNQKCAFKCNKDYHLTWDIAWNKQDNVWCYKDCVWEGKKYTHNSIVTWYSQEEAFCSDDDWHHKTCKDYKHSLVCSEWTWYLTNADGKTASSNKANGYTGTCMLYDYQCDYDKYNLDKNYITTVWLETEAWVRWKTVDRQVSEWNRWYYEVCVDYNPNPMPVPAKNSEQCDPVDPYHYRLTKCQPGYSTGVGFENTCMKNCVLDGKTLKHNEQWKFYTWSTTTCPDVCHGEVFTCNDGHLESTKPWVNTWVYNKKDCILSSQNCDGYKLSVWIRNRYGMDTWTDGLHHSIYEKCDKYSKYGDNSCRYLQDVYKLVGCDEWYHTENVSPINGQYCVSNTKTENCSKTGGPANSVYIVTWVTLTWSGTWNSWKWSDKPECDWKCSSNYHLENGECVKNTKSVPCVATWTIPAHSHYNQRNVTIRWQGTWDDGHWPETPKCGYSCDSGWCGSTCSYEQYYDTCSPNPNKPDNSHDVMEWGWTCYGYGYCDWECDSPEYVLSDDGKSCVLVWWGGDIHCTQEWMPAAAEEHGYYIDAIVTTPTNCEWACNAPYVKKNGSCQEVSTDCVTDELNKCTNGVEATGQWSNSDEYYWYCGDKYCTKAKTWSVTCGPDEVEYNWECVKCDSFASQNWNVCFVDWICGDNYIAQFNTTTNEYECVLLWVCTTSYWSYVSLPGNVNESWADVRPLGGNGVFSCVSNGSVQPHSCQYSCKNGYYCERDGHCTAPYCYPFSVYNWSLSNAVDYYENPTLGSRENQSYMWTMWTFVSSQAELNQKRASHAEWCFVYCDKTYTKNWYTVCGEKPEEKPSCVTEYHWGYEAEYENPSKVNEAWQEVSYSQLQQYKQNKTPWCYWACQPGTTKVVPWNLAFASYFDGPVCHKTCTSSQIFDSGGCKSCYEWEEPDPDSIKMWNYTKCRAIDCGANASWSPTAHACLLNVVGINKEQCEQYGYIWDNTRAICVNCLYSGETYNEQKWQCE